MYTLVRSHQVRQLLLEQGPVLVLSLVIAEIFYKFHSFTLECLAFLLTWYALEVVVRLAFRQLRRAHVGELRDK